MEMVFSAGVQNGAMVCIDIIIIDDNTVEGTESFRVSLALNTPGLGVILGNIMTVVTIGDNEGTNFFSYLMIIVSVVLA